MNTEKQGVVTVDAETIVEVTQEGPILVYGNVCIKDAAGIETKRNKVTALCRCGASNNKPYCDGMHRKIRCKRKMGYFKYVLKKNLKKTKFFFAEWQNSLTLAANKFTNQHKIISCQEKNITLPNFTPKTNFG